MVTPGNQEQPRRQNVLDYGKAPKPAPLWARIIGTVVGLLLLLLSLDGLIWLPADLIEIFLILCSFLAGVLLLWMSISGRALRSHRGRTIARGLVISKRLARAIKREVTTAD